MKDLFAITLAVAAVGIGGCTSVQPREAFPHVAQQIQDRTGATAAWDSGTSQDAAAHQAVADILARDLTADSAVQVALLCNHNVQATYESLDIAQGELVQAGLLSNPVVDAMIRFPDAARSSPDIELSVTQNFIELLSLPLRKKVAAAQYESEKARVAGEVVSLAADVKDAFYTLQAAQQTLDLQRTIFAAEDASRDVSQRLHDAGNINDLSLSTQLATAAQAKLDLAQAEADAADAREKLAALLGVDQPDRLRVPTQLPAPPAADGDLANVEALALHQRLDFTAGVAELNATEKSLGVAQQFAWFSDAEITAATEHEPGGPWITGPGVSVPVPIFDTGAARVSIAAAKTRQTALKLAALRTQIRSDARSARTALQLARQRAEYTQATLLPLRHRITVQTQQQFNGMLSDVFQLLQAKRDEIEAGRAYVDTLRDYWLAHTRLERAVGGRLPMNHPATQP